MQPAHGQNPLGLSNEDQHRIEEFCRRWRIVALDLFGSAARGQMRPGSDLDFLVSFDQEASWSLWDHARMEHELATILEREVDLVTRRAVERSANWLRRRTILEEARPVYAA